MKLHEILISASFVTVIFVGFVLLYADGVVNYGSTGMDLGNATHINESLHDINEISESTANTMRNLQGLPLGLDILGSLLVGAYGAMLTVSTSFDIIFGVVVDSSVYLPLGEFGNTLVLFAGACLLIVVFIAILGHYISKSERV